MVSSRPDRATSQLRAARGSRLGRFLRGSFILFCVIWVLLSVLLLWHGECVERTRMFTYYRETPTSGEMETWEHGWPRTYLVRKTKHIRSGAWSMGEGSREWSIRALVHDASILAMVSLVVAVGWKLLRRGAGRRQFGLRTLFCAITICGLGLGWWHSVTQEDREELLRATILKEAGLHFRIDYIGPSLPRRLLGAPHIPGHRITKGALNNKLPKLILT